MTIHRTRQGSVPSGGTETGRQIIELGGVFVEYSGAVPDQAELGAHLDPPPPPSDERVKPMPGVTPVTRAEFEDLKEWLRERLP